MKIKFLLSILVCSPAFASSFSYWEYDAIEPKIRRGPVQNLSLVSDWTIAYSVDSDSKIKLGGVVFDLNSDMWAKSVKHGNCFIIKSKILYDKTVLKKCQLEKEFEKLQSPILVELNGKPTNSSGNLVVSKNESVNLMFKFDQFPFYIEANFQKPSLEVVDISILKDKWFVLLQYINKDFNFLGLFDKAFPFTEKLYIAEVDNSNESISIMAIQGIRYTMPMKPPSPEQSIQMRYSLKPKIVNKRRLITYSKDFTFQFIDPISKDNVQDWKATQLEKFKWNESVREFGDSKLSVSILRMPQFEASTRLSFLSAGEFGGQLIPSGEVSILGFHENFISDRFDQFFTHRLGWKLRSFNSLAASDSKFNLSFNQAEVRFLLNQSVWNIEQVTGVLFANYNFKSFDLSVSQPGVGFFWGRPMPNIFDSFLRWILFFQYPKYVDLDLTYLPANHPNAGAGLLINFHGKMFFPNHVFFEGGLSYYNIDSVSSNNQRTLLFQTFVGTLGLGYMF